MQNELSCKPPPAAAEVLSAALLAPGTDLSHWPGFGQPLPFEYAVSALKCGSPLIFTLSSSCFPPDTV